jgi:hypothetical protein
MSENLRDLRVSARSKRNGFFFNVVYLFGFVSMLWYWFFNLSWFGYVRFSLIQFDLTSLV